MPSYTTTPGTIYLRRGAKNHISKSAENLLSSRAVPALMYGRILLRSMARPIKANYTTHSKIKTPPPVPHLLLSAGLPPLQERNPQQENQGEEDAVDLRAKSKA